MNKADVIALVNRYQMTPFYDVIFRKHGYHCYTGAMPEFDDKLQLEYRSIRPDVAVVALYSGDFENVRVIREDWHNGNRFYRILCPLAWYPANADENCDLRNPKAKGKNRRVRRGGSPFEHRIRYDKTGKYL